MTKFRPFPLFVSPKGNYALALTDPEWHRSCSARKLRLLCPEEDAQNRVSLTNSTVVPYSWAVS